MSQIVRITKADIKASPSEFGTAFAVHVDQDSTYIVTCAHVYKELGGDQNGAVHANGDRAELAFDGRSLDVDIVVLKAKLSTKVSVYELQEEQVNLEDTCLLIGFNQLQGAHRTTKLKATVEGAENLILQNGVRTAPIWVFKLHRGAVRKGYSGSPLINPTTNRVLGIITHNEEQEASGVAYTVDVIKQVLAECLNLFDSSVSELQVGFQAFQKILKEEQRDEYAQLYLVDYQNAQIQITLLEQLKALHKVFHHNLRDEFCWVIYPFLKSSERDSWLTESFQEAQDAIAIHVHVGTLGDAISAISDIPIQNATAYGASLEPLKNELDDWLKDNMGSNKDRGEHALRICSALFHQINHRLNEISQRLLHTSNSLDTLLMQLCEGMKRMLGESPGSLSEEDKHRVIEGIAAVELLRQILPEKIKEHAQWQDLDAFLLQRWTPQPNPRDLQNEIPSNWDFIQSLAKPLYENKTEDWAERFNAQAQKLESALSKRQPIKVPFSVYQNQTKNRFRAVDSQLLTSCQSLKAALVRFQP